ncbi:hypothetical protein M8J75_015884 [Diaphorina citri]|nr:hypothetical protein M8J75_015884 [Diaphorina citri]KAI5727408.1 hypothetical protein M8J77_001912 [Diaphorina citri]
MILSLMRFLLPCLTLCSANPLDLGKNLTDELNASYGRPQPDAQLNRIIGRFCNFLQAKTDKTTTDVFGDTLRTRFVVFKFVECSTKLTVRAGRAHLIEKAVQDTVANLTGDGLHLRYFAAHAGEPNKTAVRNGFLKHLVDEVLRCFPKDLRDDFL